MLELLLPDLDATQHLAQALARLIQPGDCILLEGSLGAGKTTLARALLRAALADPALEVPSPTYTLVQSYAASAFPIHHLDLWRLEGPDGLPELGWDEMRDGAMLVEWPDRLGHLRPADALGIGLSYVAGEARLARLQGWDDRLAGLAIPPA